MSLQWIILCFVLNGLFSVQSITFNLSENAYALYPVWNACPNASVSFDFKTTAADSFLFYVDDQTGDGFDFIQIHIEKGRVRMVANIVDGHEGNVQIIFPEPVNDGRWHSVKYQRKRMNSIMTLDGKKEETVAFGSDFQFGITPNTYGWFGGIKPSMGFSQLNLPSVILIPRFEGSFRNIVYQNCTCQSVRVSPLEGRDYSLSPRENCESNNPCREGCLCVSNDLDQPTCDCSQMMCSKGSNTHYHLPMDTLHGTTMENYGGLDSSIYGTRTLVPGVNNTAVKLDGVQDYIRVSGPSHRNECFGDLTLCDNGYTIALWIKIIPPISSRKHVYLSNGGHSEHNHGIALLYDKGWLHMKFKDKMGHSWRASARGVLPGNWYHVVGAWSKHDSKAFLYMNGRESHVGGGMETESPAAPSSFNDYVLGRANEPISRQQSRSLLMDEFHFWPHYKSLRDTREIGPLYAMKLSFDSDEQIGSNGVSSIGRPKMVPGVMGRALELDGRDDYLIVEQQGKPSCFSDLSLCLYGVTLRMWVKFMDLKPMTYILDSGALKLYVKNDKVVFEANKGGDVWKTEREEKIEKDKWYYIEGSWDKKEAKIFLNHKDGASSTSFNPSSSPQSTPSHNEDYLIFIGKSSDQQRTSNVVLDQFEMFYGDRKRLNHTAFILTGRPDKEHVAFDTVPETSSKSKVTSFGSPRLVTGRVGKAYELDGSEYVSLGKHQDNCLGNLDFCQHGALMSAWIKPSQLEPGMHIFSTGSNGLKGKIVDGRRLRVTAKTTSNEWQLTSEPLEADQWQFLEVAWKPEGGLKVYVDQEMRKGSVKGMDRTDLGGSNPNTRDFLVGRGDGLESDSKFGKFAVDDLEYWHANREYLMAFGYIQRGKPASFHIDMDKLDGNRVAHDHLVVQSDVHGKLVAGKVNGAYELDGARNFLTLQNLPDGCFKDLKLCPHGLTYSFFANFHQDNKDQYYLSNGGGVSVYQRQNQKYVSFVRGGDKWEVPVTIDSGEWHFLESTWHPDKGLKVFVDNKLAGQQQVPEAAAASQAAGGDFMIGNGNAGDRSNGNDVVNPGKATIDEFEMWQSDKDYLQAFDYILRDKVPHYSFPMEMERGNRILHPQFHLSKYNGAHLRPGRVGKALELGGNGEFVSFGDQRASCMGNLDKCPHGVTTSFFINPNPDLDSNLNPYYISSAAFSFLSSGPNYTAFYQKGDKRWEVSSDRIQPNQWQKVEVSWDEDKGIQMLKDGVVIGEQQKPYTSKSRIKDHSLYLGRPIDDNQQGSTHGRGLIDEMQFWFANRDHLKAFDLIQDDIKSLKVDMDKVQSGVVQHPSHHILAEGGAEVVDGVNNGAVSLNGNEQYLDLGPGVLCNSDLRYCPNGLTTRVKLKPHNMVDGSYIISSPTSSLSKQNGKLVGEVRSGDQKWRTVQAPLEDGVWSQVDMSWHPSEGMSMYVNNKKVAESIHPTDLRLLDYNQSAPFYIGRSDSPTGPYATFDVDDLELYEAKRESLLSKLVNPEQDQRRIDVAKAKHTTSRPRPGTSTKLPSNQESAVTFVTSGPQVNLPQWQNPTSLEFIFRTAQPDALVFYQGGEPHSISVEMYEGLAYLNLGPSKYSFPASAPLDDNQAHNAKVQFPTQDSVLLSLDGVKKSYDLKLPVNKVIPNGKLLVGGVQDANTKLPFYIWNADKDSRRYLGCLWGVKVNDEFVDLHSQLPRDSNVQQECKPMSLKCREGLCGKGRCLEAGEEYRCDCSNSNFIGRHCDEVSQIGSFSGDDQVSVNFRPTTTSTLDHFSVRFRSLKENGLLLATSNNNNNDHLKLMMERGRAKVQTSFEGVVDEIYDNCAYKLNDAQWHTLHVQRRDGQVDVSVDQCRKNSYEISGDKAVLDVDNIHIGKQLLADPFIGDMRNIVVKDISVLDSLPSNRPPGVTIEKDVSLTSSEANIMYPATFRDHPSSIVELHPLNSIHSSELEVSFKTSDPNGLLLYNGDPSGKFFAIELHGGRVRVVANDEVAELSSEQSVADNEWHKLSMQPTSYPQHRLNITLDHTSTQSILDLGTDYFDLSDNLVLGGVASNKSLPSQIRSSGKGFTGCLASLTINGRVYDVMNDAIQSSSYVTSGCTDTSTFCAPDLCHNGGVCQELKDNFYCDCSLTSFIGHYCHTEGRGLRIGNEGDKGINIYRIEPPVDSDADKLAFGFMTWRENGTLVKAEGNNDFIEASMDKGNLQFAYDIGDGEKVVLEDAKAFNDGSYHVASFEREGGQVTVKVDDLPERRIQGAKSGTFKRMHSVKVGGDLDADRNVIKPFDGIIAGVHLNSQDVIEEGVVDKKTPVTKGAVIPASHPFYLQKPTVPPPRAVDEYDLLLKGGGGAGWSDEGVMLAGDPKTAALMQDPPVAGASAFPRASAVAGAMIGLLLAATSLMWAAYKFKPGFFSASGFAPPSYHAVSAVETRAAVGKSQVEGGFEMKSAKALSSSQTNESHIYDTTAAFATLSSNHGYSFHDGHNSARSASYNRQSSPLLAPQEDSRHLANNSHNYQSVGQQESFAQEQNLQQQNLQQQNLQQQNLQEQNLQQQNLQQQSFQQQNLQQHQTLLQQQTLQQQNTQQQQLFPGEQQIQYLTRSSSPFQQQQQLQQQQLQQQQLQQQQLQQQQFTSQNSFLQQQQAPPPEPPFPNLMGSEDISVNCVQLTTNGRYVVTGSVFGPPQVWDMKTGELVRIMQGDDLSSTDLHLANGDSLLIGQVADQSGEQNVSVQDNISPSKDYRKLQVWDFSSGRCVEMKKNEWCTASCMMGDGERLVVGRTEKMGQGTTITIWDILGNEPIRHINWNGFVGSYDDPLTFITLSNDNRYIIAGAQNSSDTTANYVTFDLTTTDFDNQPPNIVSFDAEVATTVVLENHEAVTGSRKGELIVWSLRTGRALRQLMSPLLNNPSMATQAHQAEVTGLCLSKDDLFLISSSCDGSLKVWNMETERLERILSGHLNEVLCCSVSNDNELVVSGSSDQTIRLWRLDNGQCMASLHTGIDVFKVLLSNNKKTIVALADKKGSRKLVMLQVVRTKVPSTSASRATSPLSSVATANFR